MLFFKYKALAVTNFRPSVAERTTISVSRRVLLYGVSYTKGKFGTKPSAMKHFVPMSKCYVYPSDFLCFIILFLALSMFSILLFTVGILCNTSSKCE